MTLICQGKEIKETLINSPHNLEEQVPNVLTGEYDICRVLADSHVTRCLTCTYSDVFAHESECAACEHRYECGRCPASSLQHGSIYARDTFACRIMKGGYMEERVRRIMESDDSERKNESVMADAGAKR